MNDKIHVLTLDGDEISALGRVVEESLNSGKNTNAVDETLMFLLDKINEEREP